MFSHICAFFGLATLVAATLRLHNAHFKRTTRYPYVTVVCTIVMPIASGIERACASQINSFIHWLVDVDCLEYDAVDDADDDADVDVVDKPRNWWGQKTE